MISVDSMGRMGNQMFQLAFAHAASRRLETSFVMGPLDLGKHFTIGPWGSRRVRVARKLAFRLRYGSALAERVDVPNEADPEEVLVSLRDGVAYGGFFQSADYFAGYEDEVRGLFRLRPHHRRAFEKAYAGLDRYACVHVRRGDYVDWKGGRALPLSYFRDALALLGDLHDYDVVVISDDLPAVADEFADVPRVRFEANPPLIDLQLLTNADVVIASPSSFSWWGAWLNQRPGKRVLVPDHWIGFTEGIDYPQRVIPTAWQRVPVTDAAFGR